MSHLENLERKLREMSENGTCGPVEEQLGDVFSEPSGESDIANDLTRPKKFVRVAGFDGRCNDLVYCKPLPPSSTEDEEISVDSDSNPPISSPPATDDGRQKCLVFFGGDMQDFPELMEQHKEHRGFLCWNLESTAQLLLKQFPNHHIVVVRPSRIQIMTFSCFDNFVNSASNTGVPDHVITNGSLQHLELLLRSLSERIEKSQEQEQLMAKQQMASTSNEGAGESEVSSTTTEEVISGGGTLTTNGEGETPSSTATANTAITNEELQKVAETKPVNPHLDRAKISLVGFSKGCVVLNQLLYEFHYLKTLTPDDSTMAPFLSCIEDMYWLDGGHNGGKNTWITSRSLIETLSRQGIRIHVHMTPYQLSDERRPWIRKEERMFSDWLKRFNAPIKRYVHFENEHASLQQHFRLLGEFGTAEKTMEPESNNEVENEESTYTGVLSI